MWVKTIRHPYAPSRMAKFRTLTTRCDTTASIIHCWWECKMAQQSWKAIWQFPKKPSILFPNYLAILLLSIYSEVENVCAGPHKNLHTDVCSSFIQKTIHSFKCITLMKFYKYLYNWALISYILENYKTIFKIQLTWFSSLHISKIKILIYLKYL